MKPKKVTEVEPEKDFQTIADEHGEHAVKYIRKELDMLDHARNCPGTDDAGGPCKVGADGDYPEAWHDEEKAEDCVQESHYGIQVRSDWHTPGEETAAGSGEYIITLGGGGPASRIIGEFENGYAHSAHYEFQDWFKPWTEARLTSEEEATLLEYAQHFYFGE